MARESNKKSKIKRSTPVDVQRKRQRKGSSRSPEPAKSKTGAVAFISKTWNFLFYIIMFAILIGAVLFKFDNSPTKSMYGYHFMTVKTDSMAPNKKKTELKDGFPAGSFIVVQKTEPKSLKVGDIITFFPVAGNTTAYLTHRVIEVDTPILEGDGEVLGLTTQGDANDGPDFPIKRDAVVGKVIWSMSSFGNIIDFIRDKYVVVAIFIIVLFAFTLTLKYYMAIPMIDKKRRKR